MNPITPRSDALTVAELIAIIEQVQRAANRAGKAAGLKGDEIHPLNVIDVALFGCLMVAKTAAGIHTVSEEGETK